MKLKEILSLAGTATVASNPLIGSAIKLVNSLIPKEGEKLSVTATVAEIGQAFEKMPQATKNVMAEAEIELEKIYEEGATERYKAMCDADGQETRAELVRLMAKALIWITSVFLAAFCVLAYLEVPEAILAVVGTTYFGGVSWMAYCVRAYFGDLRSEAQSRHRVADDKPAIPGGIAQAVAAFRGK